MTIESADRAEGEAQARETRWANMSFVVGAVVFALFMLWPLVFNFNVFRVDDYVSKYIFADAFEIIKSNPHEESSVFIRAHIDRQSNVLLISLSGVIASIVFIVFTETGFFKNPGKIGRYRVGNLFGFAFFYAFLIFYMINSWEWMCFYNIECSDTKKELEWPVFYSVSFILVASSPYLGRVLLRAAAFFGGRK